MKPEEIVKEIIAFGEANYNEANVKKYSRYFKEGVFDSWGLVLDDYNRKIEDILSRKGVDFNFLRAVSLELVKGPKYDMTSFAIIIYRRFFDSFSKETFRDIEKWFGTGITNWGHCDVISGELLFAHLDKKLIDYKELKPWITATNKYQRRAVPVTLIKLLKGAGSSEPFFKMIEPLMTDPEREVHQGVGWFLRESWKLRKDETEVFLLKWKEVSPRLIFQYACEKMTPAEKLRFKKSK